MGLGVVGNVNNNRILQIQIVSRLLDGGTTPFGNVHMSVASTDSYIEEPEPFSLHWFSHKMNCAGLRYKAGVLTGPAYIAWVAGPFTYGAYPDEKTTPNDLNGRLNPKQRASSDNGYADERVFVKRTQMGLEDMTGLSGAVTKD